MTNDYLRKYADRYRLAKGADGIWNIRSSHKTGDGVECDVFQHSATHLGALLPPVKARKVVREHPETFTLHQLGEDAGIVLFAEAALPEVAEMLHLRRRTQLSAEEKAKRGERLRRFWFDPARESDKNAEKSTIGPTDVFPATPEAPEA